MKVKATCSECNGSGFIGSFRIDEEVCPICDGAGKTIIEVPAEEIDKLTTRPASIEHTCICGKKEVILRPISLQQIPHGWLNWSNNLLCGECKALVVYAALLGANQKIQLISSKNGKKKC